MKYTRKRHSYYRRAWVLKRDFLKLTLKPRKTVRASWGTSPEFGGNVQFLMSLERYKKTVEDFFFVGNRN